MLVTVLPAQAAPRIASRRMLCPLHKPIDLGERLGPSPAAAEPLAGRRWEPGEGGCAEQWVSSFISPAARGEQPPLSLPVCAREGEGARRTLRCVCPVELLAGSPVAEEPPEHRQPPALCAGLRLAVFAG